MSDPITLYDVPSNIAKDTAWSPSTWKVRFALNIKGLSYKTSWVEYPDIASVAKRIGAESTAMLPIGPRRYSVPIIHDPSTNSVMADSFKIIQYLDKTYPDTPTLREVSFGMSIEEIAPEGSEKRVNLWKETMSGLATINSWLSVENGVGTFIMGDQPSFADTVVASVLTWMKRLLGEESNE